MTLTSVYRASTTVSRSASLTSMWSTIARRRIPRTIPPSLSVLLVLAICSCGGQQLPSAAPGTLDRFRDHDGKIPPLSEYDGPLFALSQNYPDSLPEQGPQPWLEIDPMQDPDAYQLAIRDYFLEGMIPANFRGQDNEVRKWYNVPWMHVGRNPREAIRGLTNERASRCLDLGDSQNKRQQNWGIGLYNSTGGYTVGRVWADADKPDPSASQFLEGVVVVKLLFSDALDTQVPDLRGAPAWTAYITGAHIGCDVNSNQSRQVRTLRLLQMDIAVKDRRAGITGWFFGSLVYDQSANATDAWRKLSPGGLQWGPDHGYGSAKKNAGRPLLETHMSRPQPVLSTYKGDLGWLGRLNGPIDNPLSSCMSCHSTAQWPRHASLTPGMDMTEEERMHWFRPLAGDEAFTPGATPLDYSLQIQLSLENFKKSGGRAADELGVGRAVEEGYPLAR